MENINNHEENPCGRKFEKWKGGKCAGGAGCIYGLAFIGAVIYYIQLADTFWAGVLGILKAIVWPAMLVYKLLGFLGM